METMYRQVDERFTSLLKRWAVPLLRISLALVFIWFGALKVLGVTPVTALVADTVYWVDPDWFVPLLGWVEIVVGIGLLFRIGLKFVLGLFFAQMAGTFMVLIVQPDIAFQDNFFELTVEGEFVVKNLVLLSAGLVVGATIEREQLPAKG